MNHDRKLLVSGSVEEVVVVPFLPVEVEENYGIIINIEKIKVMRILKKEKSNYNKRYVEK